MSPPAPTPIDSTENGSDGHNTPCSNTDTPASLPTRPTTNPEQSPPTFSLQDDEEAQLAQFDRYLLSDPDFHRNSTPTPRHSTAATFTATRQSPLSAEGPSVAPVIDSSSLSNVEALAVQYPTCDRDVLTAVLSSCSGDIKAAHQILRDATGQTTSTTTNEDSANDASTAPQRPLETLRNDNDTSSDAALAAILQRQEASRAAATTSRNARNSTSSRSTAPVRPRQTTLTPTAQRRLLTALRESIVPALHAHFSELILPDTRDTSASTITYTLRSVQVAGLALPTDNVAVQAGADAARSILVNVTGANLELEVGHWSYESTSSFLPPMRDAGRARASIHGLNIDIRLEPRAETPSSNTYLSIAQCEVTVDGAVRFKTRGAAADWAYNAIAVLFKPWMLSYVKEAVADAIVRALSVHLRQLEVAARREETPPVIGHVPTATPSQGNFAALSASDL